MRGGAAHRSLKYDVIQRVKPEESITNSSLSLTITEAGHCEEVAKQPTWQSSNNICNSACKTGFSRKIKDFSQNDAEPHLDRKLIPSPQPLSHREREQVVSEERTVQLRVRGRRVAFTLAETMIVLVVLGIVAAITIPALVNRHVEAERRTKLKKAMTVYDMALNKIVIENNLKSEEAVENWANANGPCINSSDEFKVSENVTENGVVNTCKFKDASGIWWDITNILNPTIGLRASDLDENANSDTRFKLLSHFDKNGSLRVDDLAYEQSLEDNENNINALSSLYNFISGKITKEEPKTCDRYCKLKNNDFNQICTNLQAPSNCKEMSEDGMSYRIYDENGNFFFAYDYYSPTDSSSYFYTHSDDPYVISHSLNGEVYKSGCDEYGKNCSSCFTEIDTLEYCSDDWE